MNMLLKFIVVLLIAMALVDLASAVSVAILTLGV